VLGKAVHDPTSGFVGVNRNALNVFRGSFPLEYPEIEALVVLQRRRFRFEEVPCKFRPRTTGRSTITAVKSLYYVLHVLLGVFVNVLKFDRRYHRFQREHTPQPPLAEAPTAEPQSQTPQAPNTPQSPSKPQAPTTPQARTQSQPQSPTTPQARAQSQPQSPSKPPQNPNQSRDRKGASVTPQNQAHRTREDKWTAS